MIFLAWKILKRLEIKMSLQFSIKSPISFDDDFVTREVHLKEMGDTYGPSL